MRCTHKGCTVSIETNSKWARIRATSGERGWYESIDGKTVYCPRHLPDWVITRRRMNASRRGE